MSANLSSFDWYHGDLSRPNAERILLNQRPGLYLVRYSPNQSAYVLSVCENHKVCHYKITEGNRQYEIGDQTFNTVPEIIDFYKRHFLDTTTLIEAAVRQKSAEPPVVIPGNNITPAAAPEVIRVKAKYNFPGNDSDDLPFKKNDILTIIEKQEDQWWMAKDSMGKQGLIPVNYVEQIAANRTSNSQFVVPPAAASPKPEPKQPPVQPLLMNADITVPALAEAIQDRHPSVYDPSELKFEKGDKILVLKKLDSGIWDGQIRDGRKGTFPFRYVKLLTSDPNQVSQFKAQMPCS